jgi:hypothetical protein
MSEYYQLHTQIAQIQAQIRAALNAGSQAIRSGGLTFIVALGLAAFATAQGWSETLSLILFVAGALGGLVTIAGLLQKIRGRAKSRKLEASVQEVQKALAPLEQKRAVLLSRIRDGDFSVLPAFADFAFQELPIDLAPTPAALRFQPQRSEQCFVQIAGVELGRLKSQTVTHRVGGGYRVGRVYVPVQKERVQTVGMNSLDVGTLAVTNHRILYLGATHKLLTRRDKMLELIVYPDSLAVTKEGRQSADYFLNVDGELLAAILDGIGNMYRNSERSAE